jgi:hypothetical protein
MPNRRVSHLASIHLKTCIGLYASNGSYFRVVRHGLRQVHAELCRSLVKSGAGLLHLAFWIQRERDDAFEVHCAGCLILAFSNN